MEDTATYLGFYDYLNPKPYTGNQINYKNACFVEQTTNKLDLTAIFFASIGILLIVISSYSAQSSISATAVLFPTSALILAVSALACAFLAVGSKIISNRIQATFSESDRAFIAYDVLVQLIGNWSKGQAHIIGGYVNQINAAYPLIDLYYDPEDEGMEPHLYLESHTFRNNPEKLVALLKSAHEKGLVLHFSHLEKSIHKVSSFTEFYMSSKFLDGKDEEMDFFKNSKHLSLHFLQNLSDQQVNPDLVRKQLDALAPKVKIKGFTHALQPFVIWKEGEVTVFEVKDYFLLYDLNSIRNSTTPTGNPVLTFKLFYRWLKR